MEKLLWAISLLLLTSCQPNKEVVIDNPSDEKITIKLDDTEVINLEPWETKIANLKFGKRQISVNDQPNEEIYLDKAHDYLLNPNKETYYIEKAKYFASKRHEKEYLENHYPEKSEVEGIEVSGEYIKIENQMLIKKIWQFGLEKDKTSYVQLSSRASKGYRTVTKIHRKKDLTEKIMANFRKQLEEFMEKE